MYYRYLASKSFNSGVVTKTSTQNGIPVYTSIVSNYGKLDEKEYPVEIVKGLPEKVGLNKSVKIAQDYINSDNLLKAISVSVDGESVIPLSQQFDFVCGKSFNRYDLNKKLADEYQDGVGLWDIINDEDYKKSLCETAKKMFQNVSSKTGKSDIGDSFYTHLIPIVVMSGVVPPQFDEEENQFFNPDGTVSIAEFLDSLNAIKYGSNSNTNRKKSVDSLSSEEDYFNEGYNSCLRGAASPFYRLYKHEELMQPITRFELAYIVVCCWYDFINKFEHIHSGTYALGVNTDWENPSKYVKKFEDGFDYKVVKKLYADGMNVVSIDVHDYKDCSMTEFKEQIKQGERGIPLPMFMSLFELDALDLFYFESRRLDPLKEVSRGEWTYFITKLAKEFPSKFVSSGDNSY